MWFGVSDYTAFVIAIVVLLALPGPGNLALIVATGKGGLRAGLAATLGVIVGDQLLLWSAVIGLSALMAAHPSVLTVIQIVGAVYLVWLGVQLLRTNTSALPIIQMRGKDYAKQTLIITLLNPKAIMFYMAFFPLFIDPKHHQGVTTFAVMAVTIAVLTLIYGAIVSSLTLRFSQTINDSERIRKWLERTAGILLILFGIHLMFSRL